MGIGDIFGSNADLRGISNEHLEVDEVTQKAFIEVNEEGAEAAAVTSTFQFKLIIFLTLESDAFDLHYIVSFSWIVMRPRFLNVTFLIDLLTLKSPVKQEIMFIALLKYQSLHLAQY